MVDPVNRCLMTPTRDAWFDLNRIPCRIERASGWLWLLAVATVLRSALCALLRKKPTPGRGPIAAFYPKVTLMGSYGYQTVALSDLFSGPARTWQSGPSVSIPVFTGGALRGNLKQAQALFAEAVAQYQKTVQHSFREVSDSSIACQRTRKFRARQAGGRLNELLSVVTLYRSLGGGWSEPETRPASARGPAK